MTPEEQRAAQLFPRLAADPAFRKTSDESGQYNCIAFAAGDDEHWWWPPLPAGVTQAGHYWPPWAPAEESVDAFVAAFEGLGYRRCDDASPAPGLEKVAIYLNPSTGRPTHAAIQSTDGGWKSKLGRFIDVSHSDPASVEGDRYGAAAVFLERHHESEGLRARIGISIAAARAWLTEKRQGLSSVSARVGS